MIYRRPLMECKGAQTFWEMGRGDFERAHNQCRSELRNGLMARSDAKTDKILGKTKQKKKLFIVFDAILGGVLGGLRSKQKKVLQNFSAIVHLETIRGPKAALN